MFYPHFPTIRIAPFAVLAGAVLGLLAACGANPPQTQSSAAQTMPLTVTQRPVNEQRLALVPIGSGRSPAIGQAPAAHRVAAWESPAAPASARTTVVPARYFQDIAPPLRHRIGWMLQNCRRLDQPVPSACNAGIRFRRR